MKETNLHSSCLLCSSEQLKDLERFHETHLTQCSNCKFVFSRRIPSNEELKTYYSSNYDVTRYFSPITEKRYNEILDRFEADRKNNRILDVGAGYGFFLEVAKKRGWEVYGTEITSEAVKHCTSKGIHMFEGTIDSIDFGDLEFDIIVCIEVLEHLNNPAQFTSKINDLLRKDGIFYLTTPNFDTVLRYWLKEKYDVIGYPNHLCYYTPKTLRKLMTESGFEPTTIKTTGLSLTRIKTSKGKSDQEYVCETSDDEMLRYRIEKNATMRALKTTANGMLDLLKIGDSLKGTFRKK